MVIATRGYTDELYRKNIELLAGQTYVGCWRIVGLDGPNDSAEYLHKILQLDDGWVINIDEDCFIYDWSKVWDIIAFMNKNDCHYAGMPDGGVCSTRARSWVVMNPFFNIFNLGEIKKIYALYTREDIDGSVFKNINNLRKPDIIKGPYDHSLISPFNGLFNWLYKNFNPLYLGAVDHPDGISTMLLDHKGDGFALHSWYSREYNTDPEQKERIDKLYTEAISLKPKRYAEMGHYQSPDKKV